MGKGRHVDTTLSILLALLVIAGLFIFSSAAFGFLGRGASNISSIAFNHLVLGVGVGLVLLVAMVAIDYHVWRVGAPYIFVAAILFTSFVFIPHIGMEHGGGRRWLSLLGITVQPSEGLKLAVILMASAYFATIKHKVETIQFGLLGFIALIAFPAFILIAQPDLGTLGVIVLSAGAVFFCSGARVRDIAVAFCIAVLALGVMAIAKPYVRDRVMTFLDPAKGQNAESYQIRQSLIAIGSGGFFGRGFGQGIQKFTYLPEPMGDSIFAVAGEELGFVGSATLILLFLAFGLRGFAIASSAPDAFGFLMAVGISTYLTAEAFINIAAMLGLAPLTGIPLTFISQGGSAVLVSLASAGILLNISRYRIKR